MASAWINVLLPYCADNWKDPDTQFFNLEQQSRQHPADLRAGIEFEGTTSPSATRNASGTANRMTTASPASGRTAATVKAWKRVEVFMSIRFEIVKGFHAI